MLAGSSDMDQEGRGAFQEWPQVEAARPYCKYAARPPSLHAVPFHVEKAVRMATHGRRGVAYIDLPGNLVVDTFDGDYEKMCVIFVCELVIFTAKCPNAPSRPLRRRSTRRLTKRRS